MPPLDPFNPAIDRCDRRSVARLFRSMWPDDAVARAVADNLAASIRAAHAAGDACWEVTMYPHGLRLNVGQVETLTLFEDGSRFLFQSPLQLGTDRRFEADDSRSPVYPSVPVPSGVCRVATAGLGTLPAALRPAHEAYIRAAASFKRSSPFKRSHSPAVIEYVESVLAVMLPRPTYAPPNSLGQRVDPLADELDVSRQLIEGAGYQVVVNAYERDPRARQLCIEAHGTACVICGFTFGAAYGPVAEGLIHVHHLRPLSEVGGEYEVNPAEDLRPVCPNCHAVLHRQVPAYSVDEVRGFLQRRHAEPAAVFGVGLPPAVSGTTPDRPG